MGRTTEMREGRLFLKCYTCGNMVIVSHFYAWGAGRYSVDCLSCTPDPRKYKIGKWAVRQRELDRLFETQLKTLHTVADKREDDMGSRPVSEALEADYWCEGPKGRSFPTVRKMTQEEVERATAGTHKLGIKPKGNA